MSKPSVIKFDKKTARKFKTIMFVALGFIVFGIAFGIFFSFMSVTFRNTWKILMGLTLYAEFIGVPVLLISGYLYFESSVYLRRLANSGYDLPEDKRKYDSSLANLPRRGESVCNKYVTDSKTAAVLYSLVFVLFVVGDVRYLLKWRSYESDCVALFVVLLLAHLVFAVGAVLFVVQTNKSRFIDSVDVVPPFDKRKVRIDIFTSSFALVVLVLIGLFGLMTAESMTNYIYKSRNGHYNKTPEQYAAEATMVVTSSDLVDGVWSSELVDRTPQLTFSEVEGASYYVIYMVDETSHERLHWYVDHLDVTSLSAGSGVGEYRGLIASAPGDVYSISVYALAGEPDWSGDLTFDDSSFAPYYYYYEVLNVADRSASPIQYGNVLEYGYISGVME